MNIVKHVLYRQNGGSGLGLLYNDVMDMEWNEVLWWYQSLQELREAEAAAIKKAQKGGQ